MRLHSLKEVQALFQHRPIKTFWKNPPSRSLDKNGNKIRQQVHVRFTERMGLSLGLQLVQMKNGGGVMISNILDKSPAARSGKLRKSMKLIRINNKDYTHCTLAEAIAGLSIAARKVSFDSVHKIGGVLTTWQIAPSRNLSQEGTRLVQPPTPSNTIRRRWKRAIHTVVLGIRARRAVDKKDTVRRITSWLHDVVDHAVDIGYQWEVESTTEAMAWACGTSFLDQGKCTGIVSWV